VRLTILLLCAAAAYAQAQSSNPPAAGLEPAWDIAVVLGEMSSNAARLLPALDRLDVPAWVAKGASETYATQLESSRQQTRALSDEAAALARNPEKLSLALEMYFRVQGLESMLQSLQDGARKYQSQQAAQSVAAEFAEGGANRDRFRTYIVNLAAEREHQFEVMDREAQRCRATLMAPAPPPSTSGRKK
jgi:hypothetical protein